MRLVWRTRMGMRLLASVSRPMITLLQPQVNFGEPKNARSSCFAGLDEAFTIQQPLPCLYLDLSPFIPILTHKLQLGDLEVLVVGEAGAERSRE